MERIRVGQRVPSRQMGEEHDFELPDEAGRPWRLREKVQAGPVLLVFYRGDW